MAARALEFAILTAARSGEVLGARWSEIDLDEKTWTVPAERMKAGVLHRVPLSHAALAILRPLHEAGASEFVFPGLRGQLNRTVMRKLLERRMNASVATVHGFRSAFRDWAAETTRFPREVAELALAHTVGSAVERAYRRSDLFELRRQLMEALGRVLHRRARQSAGVPEELLTGTLAIASLVGAKRDPKTRLSAAGSPTHRPAPTGACVPSTPALEPALPAPILRRLDRRSAPPPARSPARAGAARRAVRSAGDTRARTARRPPSDPPRLVQGPPPRLRKGKSDERRGGCRQARLQHRASRASRRGARREGGSEGHGRNGHSNGNGEGVSAEAFWAHARRLSPREPWRAVVRELGGSDGGRPRGAASHGLAFGGCRCGRGAVSSSAGDEALRPDRE